MAQKHNIYFKNSVDSQYFFQWLRAQNKYSITQICLFRGNYCSPHVLLILAADDRLENLYLCLILVID